jgi:hypothetical protein
MLENIGESTTPKSRKVMAVVCRTLIQIGSASRCQAEVKGHECRMTGLTTAEP